MLHLILGVSMLAMCTGMAGYVAYSYIHAPATTTTIDSKTNVAVTIPATWLDKASYAFKQSEALLVQAFSAFLVLATNSIVQISEWLQTPEIRDALSAFLTPETVSIVIAVILVLTTLARFRGNLFMPSAGAAPVGFISAAPPLPTNSPKAEEGAVTESNGGLSP